MFCKNPLFCKLLLQVTPQQLGNSGLQILENTYFTQKQFKIQYTGKMLIKSK